MGGEMRKWIAMTCHAAMHQLRTWGNEKIRAVNISHGASENHFGVNLTNVRNLAKEIKKDHPLGLQLWDTGNDEARLLATLVMNGRELSAEDLDRMVREITYAKVLDWLVENVLKTHRLRDELRRKWMNDENEWAGRAGWSLTTIKVSKEDAEGLDLAALLDQIEAQMKDAPPLKQWSMNHCLAEIGGRFVAFRERAIDIGYRLEVLKDYPVSKGCTSPFAPIWIDYLVKNRN